MDIAVLNPAYDSDRVKNTTPTGGPADNTYYAFNFDTVMNEYSVRDAVAVLIADGHLGRGDTIALASSILSPLPEIREATDAGVGVIYLDAMVRGKEGRREMFIPQDEIKDKIAGDGVCAFFAVDTDDDGVEIADRSRVWLRECISGCTESACGHARTGLKIGKLPELAANHKAPHKRVCAGILTQYAGEVGEPAVVVQKAVL